jgi:hypothetical protein
MLQKMFLSLVLQVRTHILLTELFMFIRYIELHGGLAALMYCPVLWLAAAIIKIHHQTAGILTFNCLKTDVFKFTSVF